MELKIVIDVTPAVVDVTRMLSRMNEAYAASRPAEPLLNATVHKADALEDDGPITIPTELLNKVAAHLAKENEKDAKKEAEKPAEVKPEPVVTPTKEAPAPAVKAPEQTGMLLSQDDLKKFCGRRRNEGVDVAGVLFAVTGFHKFSQIPEDKYQAVYEAIAAAPVTK